MQMKEERSGINGGEYFYVNEDVRSLALAITPGDATRIMQEVLERPDVVFHVHIETGTVEYMKPQNMVYRSI